MRKVFLLLIVTLLIFAEGCDLFNGDEEPPPEDMEDTEDAIGDNGENDSLPPDEDYEPVVALAYSVGGNLWLAEGDSPPISLTAGENDYSPQFSPDGQQILFRREVPPGPAGLERFELWVVGRDGSGTRQLIAHDDLPGALGQPMGFETTVMLDRLPWETVWLSDSRHIAFNTLIDIGYGLPLSYDLWIVDIETGSLTNMLPDGKGGTFVFSPDETKLLVADHGTVSLMNADGSNRKVVIKFEFVNTASEYAFVPHPVWTTDGSLGLVAISSPDPFGAPPYNSLWKINLSGDAVMMGTLPGMNLIMEDLFWSPDRVRLAFFNDDGDLCLANADGSGIVVYASDVSCFMGWAPGGQHFVFSKQYGVQVLLGSPGSPAEPFVDFNEVGRVLQVKWADPQNFGILALDRNLWAGELDGELNLIDTAVDTFDIY